MATFHCGETGSLSRWLVAKEYADATRVTYTRSPDGKLLTRTWARQVGPNEDKDLITEYVYDEDTGELTEVKYYHDDEQMPDPDTHGIVYTYTRLGRKKTVSDVVGTRTFGYDENLQLLTESIDGSSGGLYSKLITRKYEGSQDTMPGRDIGFDIGIAADPDQDYDVDYHYDSTGRFQRVEGPALPGYGVQYAYVTNSDLLDRADFMTDATTVVARADYSYETNRDLMTAIDNQVDSVGLTTLSKYEYDQGDGYDALGRRTSVVYSGPAFGTSFHVDFDYNHRSELTTADRKTGDTPGGGTLITPGPSAFDYTYDLIGNRLTYNVDNSGTPTAYSANDLNQYTATTYPTESFADPDEDGNFTADGTYRYTWDCENRLISIEPTGTPAAGDKKLEFAYDYLGRRVEKVYSTHDGSQWSEQWRKRFVYDEWNVVLVLDANDVPERKYTWGLDLSRTVHDAGGIGGLLAVEDVAAGGGSSHSYWFFYDANGNVGQLVKASDQSLPAHYEYGPYGAPLTATGSYAATNSIRFSTKWFDAELASAGLNGAVGETGLGYWGHRYYSPRLGRWLSRDPIGEDEGGPHLYAYVRNALPANVDFLGLESRKIEPIRYPEPPPRSPGVPLPSPTPPAPAAPVPCTVRYSACTSDSRARLAACGARGGLICYGMCECAAKLKIGKANCMQTCLIPYSLACAKQFDNDLDYCLCRATACLAGRTTKKAAGCSNSWNTTDPVF